MATNSFLKFNESNTNIQTYAQYLAATERLNGFPFGSKPSSILTNRFYRDNAAMIYAFAEFMKTQGFNADPSDINALVANIPLALDAKTNTNLIVSMLSTTYTNTSGTDAYAFAISGVTSYTQLQGIPLKFKTTVANTGAATLNVSALGAKNITRDYNAALVTGDIPANAIVTVVYDGTQFQVVGLTRDALKLNVDGTNSMTGVLTTNSAIMFDKSAGLKTYKDVLHYANGVASTTGTLKIKMPRGGLPADVSRKPDVQESARPFLLRRDHGC